MDMEGPTNTTAIPVVAEYRELLTVQNQNPWDPTYYDSTGLPLTLLVSNVILAESIAVIVFNFTVIWIALRSRHCLLSTPANVFSVCLSINNVFYGLVIAYYRTYLNFRFEWTEASCAWFAALNTLCVKICVSFLLIVCGERYLSLVLLKRMQTKHGIWLAALVPVESGVYTALHFVNGGKGIISRSGLFCYPTAFDSWIGAMDIMLVVSCLLTVLGGYLLVYVQLQRVVRASTSAIVFPNLGKTTMMALGQSHGHRPKTVTSSKSSSVLQKSLDKLTSALSRSIPNVSTSSKTSLSHAHHDHTDVTKMTSCVETGTANGGPSASIANLAEQRALETREAEARVVKRGTLTFAAYSCFVFPFTYFIWLGFRYGQRPNVQEDYWICATKLISEICDPIILILLDRRFNAEVKQMLRWKSQ